MCLNRYVAIVVINLLVVTSCSGFYAQKNIFKIPGETFTALPVLKT